MSSTFRDRVRRLATPRSRRSQLWACVYCGAVDRDAARAADDSADENVARR